MRGISLRLSGVILANGSGCSFSLYSLVNASHRNIGPYQCVAELHNGTTVSIKAGNLGIIGKLKCMAHLYAAVREIGS